MDGREMESGRRKRGISGWKGASEGLEEGSRKRKKGRQRKRGRGKREGGKIKSEGREEREEKGRGKKKERGESKRKKDKRRKGIKIGVWNVAGVKGKDEEF